MKLHHYSNDSNSHYQLRRRQLFSSPASTTPSPASTTTKLSGLFAFANNESSALAGIFFQASLLPYLLFLYFLAGRHGTCIPSVGNLGFQYVLLFVGMTIAGGVLAQSQYQVSLADSDWLHGTSESLLTISNVLLVYGFHKATTNTANDISRWEFIQAQILSLLWASACAVGLALGVTTLQLKAHSQLLGGIGNLPLHNGTIRSWMPWIKHSEPENALSIPTWIVHWSSVYEYLLAMNFVWKFSAITGNPTWRGLTWGMLPLHASSICAVTHHFFYNAPGLQFLVSLQGFLTLVGNCTAMIAAYRIASSVGWNISSSCHGGCGYHRQQLDDDITTIQDNAAVDSSSSDERIITPMRPSTSIYMLVIKLIVLVVVTSYLVKYGELGLDLPFEQNPRVALAFVIIIPAVTALQYTYLSAMGQQVLLQQQQQTNQTPVGLSNGSGCRSKKYTKNSSNNKNEESRPLTDANHHNGYGSSGS